MNRRFLPSPILLLHMAVVVLGACSAMIQPPKVALAPVRAGAPVDEFRLHRTSQIRLPDGDDRVLSAGSRWRAVGTLPQGTVFRPLNTVISVQGLQAVEAYLVVKGSAVQGLYLPAEASFSSVSPTMALVMTRPL